MKRKLWKEVKGKKGVRYYYDFRIREVRHRGVMPEVRNPAQAKTMAEQIWDDIFNERVNSNSLKNKPESILLESFVNGSYLLNAKLKRSYEREIMTCEIICRFFKGKTLEEIKRDDIELFRFSRMERKSRYNKKPAPATVNRDMATLKRIFSMAFDDDVIQNNPCLKVKDLKVDNARTRHLTIEEESRLLKALDSQKWLKQIVIFALNTGLRRGEIFNLKWFDVDFQNKVISIKERKNSKDLVLPMNKNIESLLKRLPKTSEYVLPSPRTNTKLNCIKFSFMKALKEAKINDFRFHDLRHTAGTRLLEAGVDITIVAKILGQKDIRMAMRYSHATDFLKREAVKKLAKSNTNGQKLVKSSEKRKAAKLLLPLNR
jgi:integrase